MWYGVLLTEGAERDLEAICDYVADFDSPASAGHVLDKLLETIETLMTFRNAAATPRNCWYWVSVTIARPSSSLTG